MMNRRTLLLGTSTAALAIFIGSGEADAQVWRFLRGKGGSGSSAPPPQPPRRCPPHGPIVVIGINNRTQIPIRKCLRCGLVFIN
jgi:hypothetical protein